MAAFLCQNCIHKREFFRLNIYQILCNVLCVWCYLCVNQIVLKVTTNISWLQSCPFQRKCQSERFDPFYFFIDGKVFNGMSTTVFMGFDPCQDNVSEYRRTLQNSALLILSTHSEYVPHFHIFSRLLWTIFIIQITPNF